MKGFSMAMNKMQKWQKEIERNRESVKLKKQKRQDVKDLRNSCIYENGYDHYIDEDGHYRDDVVVPTWFKNLSKAWQSNRELRAKGQREETPCVRSLTEDWNNWCDSRVNMLGEEYDLRTPKPKVGRPKLPDYLKKNPTKVKRSTKMKILLSESGIAVHDNGSIHSKNGHYIGWKFQPNGRVRFENEDPISVHQFLTLI